MEHLELRALMSASTDSLNIGILLLGKSGKTLQNASGYVEVDNGSLIINSKNKAAIANGKGAFVGASEIDVAGGVNHPGKGELDGSVVYTAPIDDPLASMATPAPSGDRWGALNEAPSSKMGGLYTAGSAGPGTYVGGIHVRRGGSLTLQPGVYYLQGGGLTVASNSHLRGTGVTIINAPKGPAGGIKFSDQADVTLSAPADGPYAGIVLYQTKNAAAPISVLGNSKVTVTGRVYAPNAPLIMRAAGTLHIQSSTQLGVSGQLIVKNIVKTGNTWVSVDATPHDPGDLAISSDAGWSLAMVAGSTLRETISVTNVGPTILTGVQVTGTLPPGFITVAISTSRFPSPNPDLSISNTGFSDLLTLGPGTVINYYIDGRIDPTVTGGLESTATVSPPPGVNDPHLENNVAVVWLQTATE